MKKKRILVTIFILIVVAITTKNTFVNTTAKQAEEDQTILYQDVIITALAPTIDKAIDEYYKNVLSYLPGYDSSFIKILNIERPNGNRTSHFIINIEVEPFIGPHITVGKDKISINLSYPGIPEILKFEHVEDHPLPERYKDLYLH
ncbi:Protein of unknown function [Anaerocolumna jejuensis DSM 15929]|uniref:DUF3888 domain-containing protein n=1 Tax=Anaerocolumna jejuensis DSM 15929 TaxID=1121322 RepID=A0A1M6MEY5_9FIRM|nr:DUF3888 domain-containing protein [Anaerocolumna jejuensis]SHJ82025.1 Protein of unknown function [Anaerocolumna jejuensis DSM 15929]